MKIEALGYNDTLEKYRVVQNLDSFEIGRVILEHKERYVVKTSESEFDSELIGNLRFTAESRYDFPAVGDWVAFSSYDDNKALIHAIYPRKAIIERKAVGKSGQTQIIATNVDFGLIVQAVNRDFNLNRLERYLTICNASNVEPIIVLNKTDLIKKSELNAIIAQINQRIKDVSILSISNLSTEGYLELEAIIQKGKTYCLLGSSGVGKSTIINGLSNKLLMKTSEISSSVNKGKHTTSHRELIVLNNGGIMIDNPGMREIGIADTADGLETTFESIVEYSKDCKFKDCTHIHEKGCAILEAVENGEIDEEAYANFQKMEREKSHFESNLLDRKKKDKNLGKMIKNIKKQRRDNKY
ncbi:ribosome small subunit-dependent GTPase A [Flavivirga aquimarina]|uniref:Small ribosomal subunit biogenesis GTPase RsgA n=1 Tax=Flavivirga aquimarina TaxID=2027862 RepID=A0ABT8WB20_9FLAO|nr:ribosome small subunit-dependent GTPase A [Flavivirga aquimarina]MDO5970253.1 ribosome small subunit-dependent GTPase A [Flavivirga aquimarina]